MSNIEDNLSAQITALGLPEPEREYRFGAIAAGGTGKGLRARLQDAGLQDWRFDFAWPDRGFAVEVEGGTWIGGRHTSGAGFEEDCRKYNAAALVGWIVLRYTSGMVESALAITQIEQALGEIIPYVEAEYVVSEAENA